MRCKHCHRDCEVIDFPWTGPNKMYGVDLVSKCCWENIIADDSERELTTEEIQNALREERIANDS